MPERDSITGEVVSSVGAPQGDVLGAVGSVRVEDLQHQVPQTQQQYPPAGAPPPPPQQPTEQHWMNYAQQLEYKNRQLEAKAAEFDRFDSTLRQPEVRQRFMQAWEYGTNPNAPPPQQQQQHLSAAPPPAAGMPPAAAPQQQPVQYASNPALDRLIPVIESLDARTQRIEVQNAQVELTNKLAQMQQKFGAFDRDAILEIASSRNIQNINELEDAYMTWDRYRKNAAAYGAPQYSQPQPQQGWNNGGYAPPAPAPQQQQQYYQAPAQQQWAPAPQPQYAPQPQVWNGGNYAPPQAQMPPQQPRVIPPPTGASVRSDYNQPVGNPNGPMNNQQRSAAGQNRYSNALQYARATIPPGRN